MTHSLSTEDNILISTEDDTLVIEDNILISTEDNIFAIYSRWHLLSIEDNIYLLFAEDDTLLSTKIKHCISEEDTFVIYWR